MVRLLQQVQQETSFAGNNFKKDRECIRDTTSSGGWGSDVRERRRKSYDIVIFFGWIHLFNASPSPRLWAYRNGPDYQVVCER